MNSVSQVGNNNNNVYSSVNPLPAVPANLKQYTDALNALMTEIGADNYTIQNPRSLPVDKTLARIDLKEIFSNIPGIIESKFGVTIAPADLMNVVIFIEKNQGYTP